MVSSTCWPNSNLAGSFSVSRPSTRITSPSWTRPTPNGTKSSPVGPAEGAPGGKLLHREGGVTAVTAPAADQLRIVVRPGRDAGIDRLLHGVLRQNADRIMRSPNRTTAFRKSGNRILVLYEATEDLPFSLHTEPK